MKVAVLSAVGKRKENQDCLLANSTVYSNEVFHCSYSDISESKAQLFIVADGIGGEDSGAEASLLAVESLKTDMQDFLNFTDDIEFCKTKLKAAVEYADTQIKCIEDEENICLGTTLSILLIAGGRYVALNVGDSPIKLIRKNKCINIYEEHTVAQAKISSNQDPKSIPAKDYHCLIQSVGAAGYSKISCFEGDCKAGDVFVIMSDGMNFMKPHSLKKLINPAYSLIYKNKIQNSNDNASAIIVKV